MARTLTCGCCGDGLRDTPEENTDYTSRGQDDGFGICVKCGGYNHLIVEGDPLPKYLDMSEDEFRKQMGSNYCTFMDARIYLIKKALKKDGSQEKFEKLPYWNKCHVVQKMMDEGILKW